MTDRDPQTLDAIRQRVEQATPGPWEEGPTTGIGQRGKLFVVDATGERIADCEARKSEDGLKYARPLLKDTANAQFIANAREDVPFLLALVTSLTAERDEERALNCTIESMQVERMSAVAAVEKQSRQYRQTLEKIAALDHVWNRADSPPLVVALERWKECTDLAKAALPSREEPKA